MPDLAKAVLSALALAGGAGLVAVAASAAINSNLAIEAGQTFVLGGGQRGAFSVSGENVGPVAVEVLARDGEERVSVGTVAPGVEFQHDFARGEAALLRNTSQEQGARVKVRITGSTGNLGMGYVPND
ncbi:MAG: hypothetical protein RIB52_07555 [Erythrobacter sp.]|uniref:hypothetical protein n=1 Tax=Erythrobacter sp. TaxID=1042 RepID=UPI0032ED1354